MDSCFAAKQTGSCLPEQMARPITFQVLLVSPFQVFPLGIFFLPDRQSKLIKLIKKKKKKTFHLVYQVTNQ